MKKFISMFLLLSMIVVAGCSSEDTDGSNEASKEEKTDVEAEGTSSSEENNSSTENLFDKNDIEEGYWIGQSGLEVENEDMVISNKIEYDPSINYSINRSAYVTYYSGDDILQTVLHDEELSGSIEKNIDADSIRISFDKKKLESFQLNES